MTWLTPWAWLGIGTLAVPVLVHLLARNRARLRRIATLRFVEAAPPTSTRPLRITDPLLLLVRILILAVAVTALARPSLTEDPASDLGTLGGEEPRTRVLLVDAGPSMSRFTPGGEMAIGVARRRAWDTAAAGTAADPLASSGARGAQGPARMGSTYVVEVPGSSGALAAAIDGAAAYLARVAGRREILVYSVVGVGALPPSVERARRLGIPVAFEQVALAPLASVAPAVLEVRHPASETRIGVLASASGGVRAEWARVNPSADALDSVRQAGTAYLAAEIAGSPAVDPGAPVSLVLGPETAPPPGDAASVWAGSPVAVGDLLLALRRDPGLGALARDANVNAGTWDDLVEPSGAFPPAMVAIRSASGEPAVLALPAKVNGAKGVLVASSTGTEDLLSSALVSAVGRGVQGGPRPRDLDPRVHSPQEVEQWNVRFGGEGSLNAPEPRVRDDPDPAEGSGEARLLWGVVLLLLAAEWRLRVHSEPRR